MLVACGGGGGTTGETPNANVNVSAEGVWSGRSSSGEDFDLLVLENGDFYSIFGTLSGGILITSGFDKGSSSTKGNTLSANISEYVNSGTTTGTVSAIVVPGVSLIGSATNSAGTQKVTISATPLPSTTSGYNYNTAPVPTNIFGNWTGTILNGSSAMISVSMTGGITGTNAGCTFTGTARPRSSGKNVFDMNLTFGPSPCTYPSQQVTGIALDYVLTNGKRQLLAAMQDSTKAHGYMFLAQR